MHESREFLQQELAHIEKWEQEQKDLWIWEKLGRIPFAVLDKITPRAVHDKIEQALNELGNFLMTGGRYLILEQRVYQKCAQKWPQLRPPYTPAQMAEAPLNVMDELADDMIETHVGVATVQGATTGFGGVFTLALDIPAVLGLSLKILQEIAIVYGYDPKDPRERAFIVKCMQFSCSDYVGKQAIIEQLAVFHQPPDPQRERHIISELQGWREVFESYRDTWGWKKLFQLVPVIGVFFGAIWNRTMLQDVAEAGKQFYRKRRIHEKMKQTLPSGHS
ncbi:EcsC family protein [Polycladomyces sp. WAk]|uniref:EcsC family protein n=1 Tax=Polycladomyces zharkentensis TaxID=2807616 RepID=A0ABS2WMP3_9BACL|nr:EcsC family protein [Polycladomyces sp. WAk]MBN2910716.1 EcsC family protein [Polycladomyces sp. WAk]